MSRVPFDCAHNTLLTAGTEWSMSIDVLTRLCSSVRTTMAPKAPFVVNCHGGEMVIQSAGPAAWTTSLATTDAALSSS